MWSQLKNLVLVLGISISVYWLVQAYALASLLLLVPWDTSFVRPDIGTWQRTLNDFFEGRNGEMLIYGFYTAMFTLVAVSTLRQRWEAALRVLIANLIAAFSLLPVLMLSFPITQFFFPYGSDFTAPFYQNYSRNLLPLLLIVLSLVLWGRELYQLQSSRLKAKNKATLEIVDEDSQLLRLSDSQDAALQAESEEQAQTTGSYS